MRRASAPPADTVIRPNAWMRHHTRWFTVFLCYAAGLAAIFTALGVAFLGFSHVHPHALIGVVMLIGGPAGLYLTVRDHFARIRITDTHVQMRNPVRSVSIPLDRIDQFVPAVISGLPGRGGRCDGVRLILSGGRHIRVSAFQHFPYNSTRRPPYYAEFAHALNRLVRPPEHAATTGRSGSDRVADHGT